MPLYLIYLQVPPSAYTVFRLHIKIITFQLSFPFLFPYPFHFSLQQTKYIDLFTKRLYFFSEALFGVIKLFEILQSLVWNGNKCFHSNPCKLSGVLVRQKVKLRWSSEWSSSDAVKSGVLVQERGELEHINGALQNNTDFSHTIIL